MSATESAISNVDPIVRSLLPGYLARRDDELLRLEAWCAERKFDEIRGVAHNLAGSGGAYGLPELTRIGRALEEAAEAGDPEAITGLLQAMRKFLEQVRAELG